MTFADDNQSFFPFFQPLMTREGAEQRINDNHRVFFVRHCSDDAYSWAWSSWDTETLRVVHVKIGYKFANGNNPTGFHLKEGRLKNILFPTVKGLMAFEAKEKLGHSEPAPLEDIKDDCVVFGEETDKGGMLTVCTREDPDVEAALKSGKQVVPVEGTGLVIIVERINNNNQDGNTEKAIAKVKEILLLSANAS